MANDETTQRRAFFRLCYPKRAMPNINIAGAQYHVSEVSERGLRVLITNSAAFYPGLSLSGSLKLHGERQVFVQGSVLRIEAAEVVIQLNTGLSFKDMLEEQRYMRQRYPASFAKQGADSL